jgi:hypothetical protein
MLVAALMTVAGLLLSFFLAVETKGIPLMHSSGENTSELRPASGAA